jgi:hypothetical protein
MLYLQLFDFIHLILILTILISLTVSFITLLLHLRSFHLRSCLVNPVRHLDFIITFFLVTSFSPLTMMRDLGYLYLFWSIHSILHSVNLNFLTGLLKLIISFLMLHECFDLWDCLLVITMLSICHCCVFLEPIQQSFCRTLVLPVFRCSSQLDLLSLIFITSISCFIELMLLIFFILGLQHSSIHFWNSAFLLLDSLVRNCLRL